MSEIIDCDYVVVKHEPASDLPPWLEVTLRLVSKAIIPLFAIYCLSILAHDLMR